MRLCLVNPCNPLVSLARKNRWSKYRVWKPLGLLAVAGLRIGEALETEPVKPVREEHVSAIEPFVMPQIWAML